VAQIRGASTDVGPDDIRSILEHPHGRSWRMQELGLLGLWLDDERAYRLHVWDGLAPGGEPPIHDHPFDFTSTVIAGELVNTRYVEHADGAEYLRERYTPPDEDERRADTVRLVGASETLRAGAIYHQLARELHDSRQTPGTVTLLHFDQFHDDIPELTLCRRAGTPWTSGRARPATPDEVQRITTIARARFDERGS
jgi:hypothetical protein